MMYDMLMIVGRILLIILIVEFRNSCNTTEITEENGEEAA